MKSETTTKCSAGQLSTTASVKNQLVGYGYDAAGNLTQEGSGSPSWTYTYDAENRISSIAGSASETFKYDGDGERVYKSYGAIFWRLPGGPFLSKTTLSGTINSEHIYFGGRHVAIVNGTTPSYLFPDHLGGEHVVTNASGTICDDVDTLPFGGEIDYTASCGPSYVFAGMDRGNENSSDLDYAINRYYDLRMGRFMTADWAARPTAVPYAVFGDPQSLNLYGYVRNDPVSRADADGRCADHYKDGTCKVNVDPKTGDAGAKAAKQLEGVLNKYDKAVNALSNKTKFDIKDSKGNVIGSMTGKEIKAVWNGTHFSITDKSFNNGGAGGGTSGSWKLFGGFSGNSELTPGAVKSYVDAASGRNEAPLVGLSTMTFHELSHETHFGEALTARYPVTDKISPEREAGTSSAGRAMSGTVDAPFDCSIPAGGCE